jgi:hypothetical protein
MKLDIIFGQKTVQQTWTLSVDISNEKAFALFICLIYEQVFMVIVIDLQFHVYFCRSSEPVVTMNKFCRKCHGFSINSLKTKSI